MANLGRKGLDNLLRILRRIGLKATLPPELMFLDSFYKPQTLSAERLNTVFVHRSHARRNHFHPAA